MLPRPSDSRIPRPQKCLLIAGLIGDKISVQTGPLPARIIAGAMLATICKESDGLVVANGTARRIPERQTIGGKVTRN